MTLPKKALRYGQLKFTNDKTIPSSGHVIEKATFVDAVDGEKTGFFKPLSGSYPRVLALYSVAVSVALRNSLGESAAEERLVYDEKGEICGTFSIGLKKYKPMAPSGATLPTNASEREEVYPSYNTLLSHNVAKWLIAAWRYKCDDRHPGNTDLDNILDYDMMLWGITWIMKGARNVDGIIKEHPETSMGLKSTDLDNFPIINTRTHWPTNTMPGNLNLAKRHMCYQAFRELAANPSIKLDSSSEPVSFQEQFFSAILQELLTYEPSILRERFTEYFGTEPLNYLSLPDGKDELLSKTYPKLFNAETDRRPFVDHILEVMQKEYDEFYRNTVFYVGKEKNDSGVPVMSFRDFLQARPTAFNKTKAWAEQENASIEEYSQAYKKKAESAPPAGVPNYYCLPTAAKYDLERMHARYHQIWRDAHTLHFQAILSNIDKLLESLWEELTRKTSLASKTLETSKASPKPMEEITRSIQLFKSDIELPKLDCDEENPLAQGYMELKRLRQDLGKCTDRYFDLQAGQLNDEANMNFCIDITHYCHEYENRLLKLFGQTPSADAWLNIIKQMWEFNNSFGFVRHLKGKDTPIGRQEKPETTPFVMRNHTEKAVISATLHALFDWANAIGRLTLDGYIGEVIVNHYAPSSLNVLSNKHRTDVLSYLKDSKEEGQNILGHILAKGGTESNSLNTLLIQYLVPMMLTHRIGQSDVNLSSVLRAVQKKDFEVQTYAAEAQKFVQTDPRFSHLYSAKARHAFPESMYQWAKNMDREAFKKIIREVAKNYTPYAFNIFSARTRGPEVEGYLQDSSNSNEMILAKIFCKGERESTLSQEVFKKVVERMQTSEGDYPLACQVTTKEMRAHFFNAVYDDAKSRTFNKTTTTTSEFSH
ncbi:hypothetical protein DIZ81_02450 [Legionella taurinensis]|uniref:SidE PDE domain-containing protein n=1 Tax=Legionella taurinensis TaxID=70611 RepID=A0AB38N712_9GAMM|nr:hypothetical protein [Legionella taurinensis]MDX1836267.1 hypothetical protein [Legionella taurinensis]PUT41975.1 hypothetical protein DB744_02455 [Legionella taurinensis]PUT44764.1 hypothetical protein DB746_02455 [Legionella taurinensis]PUT48084.1 hypothetical protein DB743_00615 [Legionella taurinensis]PUT48899.1 hypothetical protein DB745_02455 [Legionella taurinensis]